MKLLKPFIDSLSGKQPPAWVKRFLHTTAHAPYYPLIVGLIAFVLTLTFSFPFGCVLIFAVLLAPKRWLVIGLVCGVASGVGGALLIQILHTLGYEFLLAKYPDFLPNQRWQFMQPWLEAYGLPALTIIAASPVPQTPFVFLYSLNNPSIPGALLAISIGKSVKYLLIAWITARFPGRFMQTYYDEP